MILETLKETLANNWPVIMIFLVTMISLRFFYFQNNRQKTSLYREFFNILAIIYIFLLFQILTQVELNSGSGINLKPFTEILRYEFGSKLFYYNVIGNILVFIPFGLFVADYIKSKKITSTIIISLIVSVTVEFVQLKIGRSFDIDDIILNLIGAIIGYFIYVFLSSTKKKLPKVFQRDGIYNFICVVILLLILYYIFSLMGVINI